jgi:hypothetical protein
MSAVSGSVLAVVLAGIAAASTPDPSRLVLRFADLPSGFTQKYSHRMSAAQVRKEQGSVRPGYLTGWENQFDRSALTGAIQIVSSSAVYKTTAQAHASMLWTFRKLATSPKFRRMSVGRPLGDESRAALYTIHQSGFSVTVFAVGWRSGRIKAAALVGGISNTLSPELAIRLAQKQQARIATAVP